MSAVETPRPEQVTHNFVQTIDGRAETSEASFEVVNPSTGVPFAKCPDASEDQLNRAVVAARRAFKTWSKLSAEERRGYIGKFAARMRERANEIAVVLTLEQGKPLAASRNEVNNTAGRMEGLATIEIKDQVLRDTPEALIVLRYRPLGVVGAITPWNVPINLGFSKVSQALSSGNTVVLKPSPYTPLSTLMMGDIARETLPPGVLNILAGGNDLGRWMTEHPDIDKISFTGSVPTGKRVMASAAGTLKRVTLELGGNDPAIVLEDADLAAAAPKLFVSAFNNSGQICMATKRLYVHESRYDEMCDKMVEIAQGWHTGDGFEPGVQMGPLQNKMQYDKVLDILEDTKNVPGARIIAGGHTLNRPGYYLAPTLVADIEEGTRLVDEEQFGPILPIIRWTDLDDVVNRANDTRFGLSASVWTKDLKKGEEIAQRLEVGTAWVNKHGGADNFIPFGGAKESGLGREYSDVGARAYMEPQVVSVTRG